MSGTRRVLFAAVTGGTSAFGLAQSSSSATSAYVATAAFDLDSSLLKHFRGITVEFDGAADGNGGSVDVAYSLDAVASPSSYTSLATGVVSGSETAITQKGKSLSVKVTLNKGTSSLGPVLKKIKVRAAPVQESFAQTQYVLYLGGETRFDPTEGSPVRLRDDTVHVKDGTTMAADLVTAAKATSPISITDSVNGTYTGVIDLSNFEISQVKPREYIAVVGVRQV